MGLIPMDQLHPHPSNWGQQHSHPSCIPMDHQHPYPISSHPSMCSMCPGRHLCAPGPVFTCSGLLSAACPSPGARLAVVLYAGWFADALQDGELLSGVHITPQALSCRVQRVIGGWGARGQDWPSHDVVWSPGWWWH